jgi:uncharacterized protein
MTEEIRKRLDTICGVIRSTLDTERIYLFGSHAYGTPDKESDIDLCVIIPESSLRPLDAVRMIRRALYDTAHDISLDILVYHSSDFGCRSRTASFERKISRDGILL